MCRKFSALLCPALSKCNNYFQHFNSRIGIQFLFLSSLQKWYWKRKNKKSFSSEEVAFNKEQSTILIKEPPPKHPGDDGPMLRDGKQICCLMCIPLTSYSLSLFL